jgi:hypothetical protein
MNLSQLQADCYRRLNFTAAPPKGVADRITAFLNEAHRAILAGPGMERLRDDIQTFASVATQARYSLPPNVARIKAITERTNQRRIRFLALDQLRELDPGLSALGSPDFWVPIGQQAVAQQPSAAAGMWAASTATDTTPKVFCEAFTTGGYRYSTSVTGTSLTGTTRVQLGTRTDLTEIVKFYLDSAAAGYVSLYDAAVSGNELARLEPGKTYARYYGLQLYPTPASVVTYYVDYTRTVADLAQATDEPLLPEDFHWLLVLGALRREYEKTDNTRWAQAVREEQEGLKALRTWVLYPPDYEATPHRVPMEGSNLGPWFPRGRW